MATLPILPAQPAVDPSGDYARAQAWAMLQARYADAGNYAVWATQVLEQMTNELKVITTTDNVSGELQSLLDLLGNVPAFDFNAIADYVAPTAPTYTAIPGYSAPTLGTITAVPDLSAIVIPDTPTTSLDFTNVAFTDTLLTTLKARLAADIAGVEAAEAAMFARHEGRVASERTKAYNEITTQFSAGGWDMPPGALLAKQTEMSNESSKRLTDVSADIMMTSVKESLNSAMQLLDLLGRLHDSNTLRDFEDAKTTAQLALDGFKTTVDGLLGVAQVDKARVDAVVASNDGTVKLYLGQIEAQTAPMKAIADSNQSQAQAYSAAVSGAGAAVQASATPEELKLKAMGVQGDIAGKAASLAIEASLREATNQVETLRGLAQSAMQMIASAMNSVSSSTSFGFGGSAGTSYDGDISTKSADKRYAIDNGIAPA